MSTWRAAQQPQRSNADAGFVAGGDLSEAAELAREAGLPLVIAELLVRAALPMPPRPSAFSIRTSINCTIRMLDAGHGAAVERIQRAVAAQRADPDLRRLRRGWDNRHGAAEDSHRDAGRRQVRFHVPHRLREGYGMQSEMLEAAARDGVRLVISVDTGIRAFAAAEAAREAGAGSDRHGPSPAGGTRWGCRRRWRC